MPATAREAEDLVAIAIKVTGAQAWYRAQINETATIYLLLSDVRRVERKAAAASSGAPGSVPPEWQRKEFKPGGEKAELHYVVFGRFASSLNPKLSVHAAKANFCRALLQLPGPADALSLAQDAPSCVSVRVEVEDPSSLVYLRDALRSVTAVLAAGGTVVYDVPTTMWRSAEEWRHTFAEPLRFHPHEHIDLVIRPERDLKGVWLRTRGMHKFGRPEVTMRHAPANDQAWAELVFKLAASMADGTNYPDEAAVHASGAAIEKFVVRRQRDPDFEDVRLTVSKD